MISVDQLVTQARTWVGVPFHHQGRNRFGVDCVGFPECVLRELGELPEGFRVRLDYGRLPRRQDLVEGLRKWCEPSGVIPGALLLIKWERVPYPSHVALYTGETIIHAARQNKGVIEHRYAEPWVSRTVSAWKLPGVRYV